MIQTLDVMESIWQAIGDAIRSLFFTIDKGLFTAFGDIFEMFFDLSRTTFLVGNIYSYIFRRVFIILSIFMMFKLMVSFLTYLLSPDAITDKERGFGKLIGRIVASLLFLIGLMPTGSSKNYSTEFPDKIGDNIQQQGIIFGTLQDIQDRIISNNIIGKLILGDVKIDSNSGKIEENDNKNMGELIGLTTFASFYKIDLSSLNSDNTCAADVNYGDPIEDPDTYRFSSWDDAEAYLFKECDNGIYFIEFNPLMGLLVGLAVCILAFLFTFDVVLRAMKLAVLRLVSPIPAISYINPKSSKDGMFATYVKTLISTYLDLFLRIAIIYLVVLIISYLTTKDSGVISTSDNIGGLGYTIIIITLLFFAFQAPKFIKQALGIKDTGTGLGFGAALLGGALSGAAAGFAAGGVWGGIKGIAGGATAGAQNQWAAQMGQKPNISSRQAAMNKAAQMATHNPNAKGVGVGAMIGGGLSNFFAGTTGGRIDQLKDSMKTMQGNASTANEIADVLKNGGTYNDLTADQQQFFNNHGWNQNNAHNAAAQALEYAGQQTAGAEKLNKKIDKAEKQHDKNSAFSDKDPYAWGTQYDSGKYKSKRFQKDPNKYL